MADDRSLTARYNAVEKALFTAVPHVYDLVAGKSSGDFLGLNIKATGGGTAVCVLKRVGPDGGAEVAFGSGDDPLEALLALNRTLAGGKWRTDKPWGGQGK